VTELGTKTGQLRSGDLLNAQLLVKAHGDDLRYAPGLGWLCWDGRRWARDEREVERRAKQVVLSLYGMAAHVPEIERDDWLSHCRRSERAVAIAAMVRLATSERNVSATAAELDAHSFLLAAQNGTVDLRDGSFREHRRADLITRLAGAIYDPDATHPVWDRFLEQATGGDKELERFLARAAGYSLTGSTAEECFFFVHGSGGSGKSTFVSALTASFASTPRSPTSRRSFAAAVMQACGMTSPGSPARAWSSLPSSTRDGTSANRC
jgi:putative DNA primase/helicase